MMRLPLLLYALVVLPTADQPPSRPAAAAEVSYQGGSVVRLLPPSKRISTGKTVFEVLLIDPSVRQVVFYLDGKEVARRKTAPWEAKLEMAKPARQQLVRVEALGTGHEVLGGDEILVNRAVKPLRVAIRSLDQSPEGVEVRAKVSIPDEVILERVSISLNGSPVRELDPSELPDGNLETTVETSAVADTDFVQVVAHLADGRTVEDTQLVSGGTFQEQIDVRLVQLQVLVTDKRGRPLKGFQKKHFRIRDKGGTHEAAGLFEANDVSLLLGYSIDSSGSMLPIWSETLEASRLFLESTLTERDEGFLIDFDTHIRLVQERTGDGAALIAALDEIEPEGGTALYDSVIYSLLQFERQQGRRGLVVLTDGFDINSQADPKRAVEFAQKLGVPIYVVALEMDSMQAAPHLSMGSVSPQAASQGLYGAAIQTLHLLTDPTGGRLIRARTLSQVERALAQINAEMRNQYVLTYYTDTPPEPGKPPQVTVAVDGMRGLKARTVLGADRIY